MPALRSDPPPVGRSCARELRGRLHSSSFLVLVLATILLLVIDVTATPRPAITLAFWSSVQHGARGGFIARGYPVHFALKLAAGLAPPSLYRVDFGDGSATVTASANATISHTFLRAGRFTVRFHAYTTNVAQTIGPDVNVTDASSGYVFPAGAISWSTREINVEETECYSFVATASLSSVYSESTVLALSAYQNSTAHVYLALFDPRRRSSMHSKVVTEMFVSMGAVPKVTVNDAVLNHPLEVSVSVDSARPHFWRVDFSLVDPSSSLDIYPGTLLLTASLPSIAVGGCGVEDRGFQLSLRSIGDKQRREQNTSLALGPLHIEKDPCDPSSAVAFFEGGSELFATSTLFVEGISASRMPDNSTLKAAKITFSMLFLWTSSGLHSARIGSNGGLLDFRLANVSSTSPTAIYTSEHCPLTFISRDVKWVGRYIYVFEEGSLNVAFTHGRSSSSVITQNIWQTVLLPSKPIGTRMVAVARDMLRRRHLFLFARDDNSGASIRFVGDEGASSFDGVEHTFDESAVVNDLIFHPNCVDLYAFGSSIWVSRDGGLGLFSQLRILQQEEQFTSPNITSMTFAHDGGSFVALTASGDVFWGRSGILDLFVLESIPFRVPLSSSSLVFGASNNLILLEMEEVSTPAEAARYFQFRTIFVAHEGEVQAMPRLLTSAADLLPSAAAGTILITLVDRSNADVISAPALTFGYDLIVKNIDGALIRVDESIVVDNDNNESVVSASILSSSLPKCNETTLCPASRNSVAIVREVEGSRTVSLVLQDLLSGRVGWQTCNLGMVVVAQPTADDLRGAAPKTTSWLVTSVINATHAYGLESNASAARTTGIQTFAASSWWLVDFRAKADNAQLEPGAAVTLSRQESNSYRVDIFSSMAEIKSDFGMRVGQILTLDHHRGKNRSWAWITHIINATSAYIETQGDPWVLGNGITAGALQIGFYTAARSDSNGVPILDASYSVHLSPCNFKHVSIFATNSKENPEKSTFAVDSGDSVELLGVAERAGNGLGLGANATHEDACIPNVKSSSLGVTVINPTMVDVQRQLPQPLGSSPNTPFWWASPNSTAVQYRFSMDASFRTQVKSPQGFSKVIIGLNNPSLLCKDVQFLSTFRFGCPPRKVMYLPPTDQNDKPLTMEQYLYGTILDSNKRPIFEELPRNYRPPSEHGNMVPNTENVYNGNPWCVDETTNQQLPEAVIRGDQWKQCRGAYLNYNATVARLKSTGQGFTVSNASCTESQWIIPPSTTETMHHMQNVCSCTEEQQISQDAKDSDCSHRVKRIYFGRLFTPRLRISNPPQEEVEIKDLGIAYSVEEVNKRTDWFVVTHSNSNIKFPKKGITLQTPLVCPKAHAYMVDDYTCEMDVRSLMSDPTMAGNPMYLTINSTMGDGIKFRGQGLYHFKAITTTNSQTMCTLTAEFKIFVFQPPLLKTVEYSTIAGTICICILVLFFAFIANRGTLGSKKKRKRDLLEQEDAVTEREVREGSKKRVSSMKRAASRQTKKNL